MAAVGRMQAHYSARAQQHATCQQQLSDPYCQVLNSLKSQLPGSIIACRLGHVCSSALVLAIDKMHFNKLQMRQFKRGLEEGSLGLQQRQCAGGAWSQRLGRTSRELKQVRG